MAGKRSPRKFETDLNSQTVKSSAKEIGTKFITDDLEKGDIKKFNKNNAINLVGLCENRPLCKKNDGRQLTFVYTNADCLSNKKTELNMLLMSLNTKPDVIIITEVNPKVKIEGLSEQEFSITDYNMYSVNVGLDKKRGIIIYVVDSLVATEINMLSDFSEYIFVQIKDSLQEIITVGAFYRRPSSKLKNDEK